MNQAELLEILMVQTAIDETRILSRNAFCHGLLTIFLTCRESEYARKEAELKRKLDQREGEYKSNVRQLQHKVKLQYILFMFISLILNNVMPQTLISFCCEFLLGI